MIEPIQAERQCRRCLECKPMSAYSPCSRGPGGYHSYCKRCRSDYTNKANKLKTKRNNQAPRSVVWPRDTRELVLDVELRMWPASTNARFGVPSIGVAA